MKPFTHCLFIFMYSDIRDLELLHWCKVDGQVHYSNNWLLLTTATIVYNLRLGYDICNDSTADGTLLDWNQRETQSHTMHAPELTWEVYGDGDSTEVASETGGAEKRMERRYLLLIREYSICTEGDCTTLGGSNNNDLHFGDGWWHVLLSLFLRANW